MQSVRSKRWMKISLEIDRHRAVASRGGSCPEGRCAADDREIIGSLVKDVNLLTGFLQKNASASGPCSRLLHASCHCTMDAHFAEMLHPFGTIALRLGRELKF